MFRSEEEEKTTAPSDYTYLGNAYGYVSSLFTPALPDCKEATQTRGLLSQYKHKATSLIREIWRLNNTIQLLHIYQLRLSEFTTYDDIMLAAEVLRQYAAIVKKLDSQGPFLAEEEKTSLVERKDLLGRFISRHRIDNDPNDPDCVKLKGIIRKIQDSRTSTKYFSHEISIAILHYIMYTDLINLNEAYPMYLHWEIEDADLQKIRAAEKLLNENSFTINAFELKFETYWMLIGLRSRVAQLSLSFENEIKKVRLEYEQTRLDISDTIDEIRQLNSQRDKVEARVQRSQQIIHEEGSEWTPEAEPLLGVWPRRLS